MKVQYLFVASLLCVLLMSVPGLGAFTAYNDCVPNLSTNPANTTGIGLGDGSVGSGVLKDFVSGANTGVTLTVTNFNAGVNGTGPAGPATFTAGTDAANTFAGKVDFLNQVIWYGSSSDWYVDMKFTGLNPAMTYEITTTLDRGNPANTTRWTKISISDADDYTYAASAGAWKINDAATSIQCYNTINGYVAKWTGISPGIDGDFTIRNTYCSNTPGVEIPVGASQGMANGTTPYGYGPGGLMLVETPEPMSLGLLLLGGLGLLRRRS